jgi:2-polyprenyl-3-methyl-5-hydroxy-6-metoxy-1,4-benzoquinol methylase
MNLDELPIREKLDLLIELREKEDEIYNKFLTLADQSCEVPLPHELSSRLLEIKEALNRSFDVTANAFGNLQNEDALFWKDVARKTSEYLQPFVKDQGEFNGAMVHLINELITALTESFSRIRQFHSVLIQYFQRIIPVLDARSREVSALHREDFELIYEKLDMQIQTLQLETKSLEISTGQLNHLANLLQSGKVEQKEISKPDLVYYHFEESFRGSRDDIKERMRSYVQYFQKAEGTIVDLGCGRGEFLELLQEHSLNAIGVDSSAEMIAACRERGLKAEQEDLLQYLRNQKEKSLGGIFSAQVVEHLPPDYLMNLLATVHTRLKPGSVMVLETINIASAYSFLQMYTRDITHKTPLHPETLLFLLNSFGFQKSQILFSSPVPAPARLQLLSDESRQENKFFNDNMRKLNQLLFDYQDYAVLGYK